MIITTPRIEERPAQSYVAIRSQASMQDLDRAIPQALGEIFAWLGQRGITPTGAPFIRYLVIDMDALLDIEVGAPVASPPPDEERVHAGTLPAGRYASLIYTGIDNGIPANAALLEWGAQQGLTWEKWPVGAGEGFGARYETFLTNPDEEPDRAKWQTEVAIKLAE